MGLRLSSFCKNKHKCLEDTEEVRIFANGNHKIDIKERDMLGINEKREPVKGVFINLVIDSLKRAYEGTLTEKERTCEERLNKARSIYNFVWN